LSALLLPPLVLMPPLMMVLPIMLVLPITLVPPLVIVPPVLPLQPLLPLEVATATNKYLMAELRAVYPKPATAQERIFLKADLDDAVVANAAAAHSAKETDGIIKE
jgi:hypothetical protein